MSKDVGNGSLGAVLAHFENISSQNPVPARTYNAESPRESLYNARLFIFPETDDKGQNPDQNGSTNIISWRHI